MKFPRHGRFWLPHSPEKAAVGTLTFTRRQGVKLLLADTLCENASEIAQPIILGQTDDGSYVTLLNAICTRAQLIRVQTFCPCTYEATCLIVGALFLTQGDIRFSLWQIRIPELRAWARRKCIEINSDELFDGVDCPAVRIEYRAPEKQVLLRDVDGLDLSLVFWPLLRSHPDVTTLRQDVYLEVRQSCNNTLDDYLATATRFENFLTLATGSLIGVGSIKAVVQNELGGKSADSIIVEILYQPVRNVSRSSPRIHEFLFSLEDIKDIEQDCLKNWMGKARRLEPICALYFATLYNPSKYRDADFLALVQAVEAYHRRTSKETDQPEEMHKIRIKSILDGSPQEHRSWLEKKLVHSNELTLRRRLEQLFSKFSHLFDDLIHDRNRIIAKIYNNRNYLTHYDDKGRAETGAELLLMVETLKLLLQASLLCELGLSDAKIKEFALRSRTVKMINHFSKLNRV